MDLRGTILKIGTEEEIKLIPKAEANILHIQSRREMLGLKHDVLDVDVLPHDMRRSQEMRDILQQDDSVYGAPFKQSIHEYRLKHVPGGDIINHRKRFIDFLYQKMEAYGLRAYNDHYHDPSDLTTHVNVSLWKDGVNLFHAHPELRVEFTERLLTKIKERADWPFFPVDENAYTPDYNVLSFAVFDEMKRTKHPILLKGSTNDDTRVEIRFGQGCIVNMRDVVETLEEVKASMQREYALKPPPQGQPVSKARRL